MNKTLIASIFAASALAGCSAFSPYQSDYTCPGMPQGVICKSVPDVYKLTEHADHVSGTQQQNAAGGDGGRAGDAAAKVPGPMPRTIPLGETSDTEKPILEPAAVMRIWVAPWIDDRGDLNWPGYVFTEVTPRRWAFGEVGAARAKPLVPLQVDAHALLGVEEEDTQNIGEAAKSLVPKLPQMQIGSQMPLPVNGLPSFIPKSKP